MPLSNQFVIPDEYPELMGRNEELEADNAALRARVAELETALNSIIEVATSYATLENPARRMWIIAEDALAGRGKDGEE